MATLSTNNLAKAIYESTKEKSGADLDIILKNTVHLISKKHLLSRSKEILNQLEKIMNKKEGISKARVSSRLKLNKKLTDEIENYIQEKYKTKNTVVDYKIDDKLLGGIKIEVGDEIIDMTLKNKIYKLKNYLIKS